MTSPTNTGQRVAGEWLPIDTVPMDGTHVLVYLSKDHSRARIHTGYFHPNVKVIGGCFAFDLPPATHWMPLPAPPTTSGREGERG